MNIYSILIEVRPIQDAIQLKDISGAMALVWVVSETEQGSREEAMKYVSKHGWIVEKIESASLMPREHRTLFEKHNIGQYRKLLDDGIIAEFRAWTGGSHEIDCDYKILKPIDV